MASFVTPANGDAALAEHIAQLTEDFSGLRNIPISLSGINDAAAYAQTIKNAGTGSKGLIIYAADGTTVLLQVDSGGVLLSRAGGAAETIITATSAMFGAWTAITPTVAQSGAVAVTVTSARYGQMGKIAFVQVELAVTGSGSAGSSIDVTLSGVPTPKRLGTAPAGLAGVGVIQDVSTGTFYTGGAAFASASLVRLYQGGSVAAIGSAPSFALASGDVITLSLSYEVA